MDMLQFLKIEPIAEGSTFSDMVALLVVDLLQAVKRRHTEQYLFEKAQNIVNVCSQQTVDSLADMCQWDDYEVRRAEELFGQCVCEFAYDLVDLARARQRYTRPKQKLSVADFGQIKTATLTAFAMDINVTISDALEDKFIAVYGSINIE